MSSPLELSDLAEQVHRSLVGSVDGGGSAAGDSLDRTVVSRAVRLAEPLLGPSDTARVVDSVMARAAGLGRLEPFLDDPSISEVMVNGGGPVWIERRGLLERTDLVVTSDEARHLIERVVGPLGLRVDRLSPMVDARLPDGSRVNAVVPPIAVDGPCLTIRRFGVRVVDLAEMCHPHVAELLRSAVAARMNLVVAGGTGAGKTTVLNALAREIPPSHRLITIEDVAELALDHEHVVRLEARPASVDGMGRVGIRELVRNALRMRPDRIIVGEVRGAEALDMLQAMNTGHEGSLSTCHANSPADALRRIETMILMGEAQLPLHAVREQIRSSLDLVVEVARRSDGSRAVASVAELVDGPADEPMVVRELAGPHGILREPARPSRRPS